MLLAVDYQGAALLVRFEVSPVCCAQMRTTPEFEGHSDIQNVQTERRAAGPGFCDGLEMRQVWA